MLHSPSFIYILAPFLPISTIYRRQSFHCCRLELTIYWFDLLDPPISQKINFHGPEVDIGL